MPETPREPGDRGLPDRSRVTKERYLHDVPAIRAGLDALLSDDPVFRSLKIGPEDFGYHHMGSDFSGLVRIIIGQQVSTKAAASLWARFSDAMPQITPARILKKSDDDMRALGLSRQKAAYIRNLAQAVKDKSFSTEALLDLPEDDVTAAVTALKGMGPWSAQMYLMFGLARPDIWAPGDLGIQEGLRRYLKLGARPSAADAASMGDRFRPHRTAASILLWRMAAQKASPP